MKRLKFKKGTTLVEILLYLGLLAIITIAAMDLFFAKSSAWGHARAARNATDGGKFVMERVIQELRLANSIQNITSDTITLSTYVNQTSSETTTLEIFLDNGQLMLQRAGQESIPMNGESVRITNVNFNHIDSEYSEIVRVEITLESSHGQFQKTKTFSSATVLRGVL